MVKIHCYDYHPQFSVSCVVPPKNFKVLPSYLHMKKKPAALKGFFRKSSSSYLFYFHLLYTNPYSHLRGESSEWAWSWQCTIPLTTGGRALFHAAGWRGMRVAGPWPRSPSGFLPRASRGRLHPACAVRLCVPAAGTQRVSKGCQPLQGSWEIRPEAQGLPESFFYN